MIKPLIILFNTVSVFLFSFFFGDGPVTVTGNFPKNVKPNTEFVSEITINKGSVSGFSKLQLEVPQGITVKELESKSGNFSFAGNIAKIIWMSTPSDAEFTVKFVLIADASVIGSKNISSKFSYINNNNKEIAEMTPVEIIVGDAPVLTTNTPATETKTETPVVTNNVTETSGNPVEPNSNVLGERVITKGSNPNEYTVDVKIKKPGIKGFAKYQEILPAGFTAKVGKTNGSSFSVSDGKAKFVWVSLPTDDELIISYVLEKGVNAVNDAKLENGEFSYLENDQTKKTRLKVQTLEASGVTSEPIVSSTPTINPVNTNTFTPVVAEPITTNSITAVATNTVTAEPIKEPITNNIAKKEGNISYLVQIGAFKNAIESSVLSKKFNVSETIKSEMAEGYSKFMVGNFDEYKKARTHRETIKQKGCNSAFVVAYNNSKRITVQEALMITGQKWFK
jgi:cell division septation protein DedD